MSADIIQLPIMGDSLKTLHAAQEIMKREKLVDDCLQSILQAYTAYKAVGEMAKSLARRIDRRADEGVHIKFSENDRVALREVLSWLDETRAKFNDEISTLPCLQTAHLNYEIIVADLDYLEYTFRRG
jgi:hypothetical protein